MRRRDELIHRLIEIPVGDHALVLGSHIPEITATPLVQVQLHRTIGTVVAVSTGQMALLLSSTPVYHVDVSEDRSRMIPRPLDPTHYHQDDLT